MEWLHEGSDNDLSADFLHFDASNFPSNFFQKMLQNRFFFALASRSGFGATISDAIARSSIVFCNSVSADRIVMAVSRLLRAVAARVILLSFAVGSRKSYWSGCMKACDSDLSAEFLHLALVIFLLFFFYSVSNRFFFALASRSGFGATISDAVARNSIAFCNSISAEHIVMAASRLLRVVAAFVILLFFAAGSRKSSWSGCMKACDLDLLADFLHFGTNVFLLHVDLEQCEVWDVKSAV